MTDDDPAAGTNVADKEWETLLEELFTHQGLAFEREQPGFSPGPRWYVQLQGYVVMVTIDPASNNGVHPSLSMGIQAFLLHDDDTIDDIFSLLSRCALFEGVGLVGAHGEDGSRILMVQRKLPLDEIEPSMVTDLIQDLIHQYQAILADGGPPQIHG